MTRDNDEVLVPLVCLLLLAADTCRFRPGGGPGPGALPVINILDLPMACFSVDGTGYIS